MKYQLTNHRRSGVTLLEVVIVLVSVAVLLLLLLPSPFFPRDNRKAPRVHCTATLKHVALGFLLWANEHENKLPMEVSVTAGGSREHALAGNIVSNYLLVANQISDARVLICASDKKRKQVTNFANLTSANISYFLNIDAAAQNQSHILVGDRDITNGLPIRSGILTIPDPYDANWASILHRQGGNLGLVDGSVHQVTGRQFQKLLDASGITNRFMIP